MKIPAIGLCYIFLAHSMTHCSSGGSEQDGISTLTQAVKNLTVQFALGLDTGKQNATQLTFIADALDKQTTLLQQMADGQAKQTAILEKMYMLAQTAQNKSESPKIVVQDYDYHGQGNGKQPNGRQTPSLATSLSQFTFDDVTASMMDRAEERISGR